MGILVWTIKKIKGNLTLQQATWLDAYRPHYFEITLDITPGCSIQCRRVCIAISEQPLNNQGTAVVYTNTREWEIYTRFEHLVSQHFIDVHSVKAYADKMHISAKHLSETVKKVSGQSALQLIHNVQLSTDDR